VSSRIFVRYLSNAKAMSNNSTFLSAARATRDCDEQNGEQVFGAQQSQLRDTLPTTPPVRATCRALRTSVANAAIVTVGTHPVSRTETAKRQERIATPSTVVDNIST
jgi:hypothetical protein